MTQVGWRFPPLSGGTRQGYTNNDIEVFKGQELIDNLAREICQNSLDARIEGTDIPVRVVFELRQISRSGYDVFSQYSRCLEGCRKYWGTEMDAKLCRFVEGAEATLTEDNIPVLIASDYNTKGLSGSHNGKLSSSWEALTGSDGVSVKSDENSAGSYGIGKNAPFACSSLSMVFYNTVAENNESAFIGVARLATLLNEDGKPTQRVGKYQNNDEENEKWFPIYDTDENDFRDCFHRIERGTDVIIVGFTQTTNWLTNVTKAVLKNFFVAISEGRLVVELKNGNDIRIIDESTLSQLFADFSDDTEMLAASQLYKAFTSPDYKETMGVLEAGDVEVYIKSDSSYKRTIANFRATGMLVGTYYKRIFQHYAAVVIVRGSMLGELLSVCVAACVRKADSRLPMVPWAVSQKNWVRHCAYMERWLCESMKPGRSTPSSRWISLRRCRGASARSSSSVPTARIFPSLMQTASAVGFPSSIVSISGQEISVHSFVSITISFLNR